jgi:hypothetical protein
MLLSRENYRLEKSAGEKSTKKALGKSQRFFYSIQRQ